MTLPQRVAASGGLKNWGLVGLIGVAAVMAGLMLPQLLPALGPTAENPPATPPPTPASAPGGINYAPSAWPDAPDHQAMLVRLAVGTAIVLALCVVTIWGCKRWLRTGPAPVAGNEQLRLLETLPLGNRCCVHLVHVANRPVLIGADAGGIKTVVPLPETFSGALLEAEDDAPLGRLASPANRLR